MDPCPTVLHLLNSFKRGGDSDTPLGSMFQCLTTLLMKSLNLPWHDLRPFPLVLSLLPHKNNTDPHVSAASFHVVVESHKVLLSLLSSRLNILSSISLSCSDWCSRPFTSFVPLLSPPLRMPCCISLCCHSHNLSWMSKVSNTRSHVLQRLHVFHTFLSVLSLLL